MDEVMRIIFVIGGAKESDGHFRTLAESGTRDYLMSYYYLKLHPTDLEHIIRTGMVKRKPRSKKDEAAVCARK